MIQQFPSLLAPKGGLSLAPLIIWAPLTAAYAEGDNVLVSPDLTELNAVGIPFVTTAAAKSESPPDLQGYVVKWAKRAAGAGPTPLPVGIPLRAVTAGEVSAATPVPILVRGKVALGGTVRVHRNTDSVDVPQGSSLHVSRAGLIVPQANTTAAVAPLGKSIGAWLSVAPGAAATVLTTGTIWFDGTGGC